MEFFKLITLLSSSILWLVSSCVASDPASEVAIRYNVLADSNAAGKKKMPLGTSSYFEMISGGVFVDKSLFIDSVLSHPYRGVGTSIVITCPKRWGKSMNLMMLKEYLQLGVYENGTVMKKEDTPNYKVFTRGILENHEVRVPAFEEARKNSKLGITRCANETGFQSIANGVDHVTREVSIKLNDTLLISSEKYKELSEAYLAEYPVIYVSLAGFSMATKPESFLSKFKDVISESFKEHKYMSEILKSKCESPSINKFSRRLLKKEHDEFESYLHKTNNKVERSVNFLSKILYKHFHQRVFILIDEYDSVFNIRGLDTSMYIFFLHQSILPKVNTYLAKGVLSGILPFEMASDYVYTYEFVGSPFHKYYGYTRQEMELLYEYYNVEREEQDTYERWYDGYRTSVQDNYERWYNGYRTSDDQISRVVNPWSTNNYMNTRKADTYWLLGTSYLCEMRNVFNADAFVILEFLIQSGKTFTSYYNTLRYGLNSMKLGIISNETLSCDDVLKYFLFTGYLTRSSYRTTLSIPNEEVRVLLQTIQDDHFRRRYEDEWKLIQDARQAWINYFESNGTSTSTLEGILKRYLESYPFFSTKFAQQELEDEHGNEAFPETTFSITLRGLGKYNNLYSIRYGNLINCTERPDILLCSSTMCIVIELKYNQTVQSALDEAKKFDDIFNMHRKFAGVTKILHVGCNVDEGKNVRIGSEIVSFKWDDHIVKKKEKSERMQKQSTTKLN